ncbi:MAG: bifunctional riboflavin kinase/FAD synthetase [Chlamydiia bacterium]|nr:bifunctional riboflavin kinase/FAD synthetase [Chlamydiia bacterium]
MFVASELDAWTQQKGPYVVSLGNFDGVHLGHQALLQRLKLRAAEHDARSIVLTFSNHPSEILRPAASSCRLCTVEHRLRLIQKAGIDSVALLDFTPQFAEQSAEEFIQLLRNHLHLSGLVLGYDAAFGKDRGGSRELLQQLSDRFGFFVEYIPPMELHGTSVSSTKIRGLLRAGELSKASELLGRPYSVLGPVIYGAGKGAGLGFPTLNLDVDGLCLPPSGVYAAWVGLDGRRYPAVANLGLAPTLQERETPVLEAHLLGDAVEAYGMEAEITPVAFLREEQKFESKEALVAQIQRDIARALAALA